MVNNNAVNERLNQLREQLRNKHFSEAQDLLNKLQTDVLELEKEILILTKTKERLQRVVDETEYLLTTLKDQFY
jgi:cytochrome b involved in lipid metabolism